MNPGTPSGLFEIVGADSDDPLGLWTARQDQPIHFGMDDETLASPTNTLVYRIQLPEDMAAADSAFREREESMRQSARALESIPERLESLVLHTQLQQKTSGSQPVHFGTDMLPDPEAELLSLLLVVDTGTESVPLPEGQVDFGIMDEVVLPGIEQARAQLKALLEQLNRELLHFAWIETVLADQIMARTSVRWTGHLNTIWTDGISPSHVSLHARSLRLATHSRALKVRLATTVMSGAAKISALMVNPAGALLALPLVYRYASQILAQAAELRTPQ
ncbi:MAG TPA: hypothetical protein VFY26_16385 [Anaerolineales bacterium]|nr:hypothetical protein [Anaerolineales bacterium]